MLIGVLMPAMSGPPLFGGMVETVESERTDLPLAIMVTVHWQDGRVESWLRRSMGNGYRERYGRWEAVDEDR